MNSEQRLKIITIAAAFSLAGFTGTVAAIPIIYSGYDVGSTSLAGSPNATTASAAFDLATGPLSIIDFEAGMPAGVSASGGSIGDATSVSVCSSPDLHCYATSPVNVYRNNGAIFTFVTPIDSFGAYFTGWQITGQKITLGYSGGGTEVLDMPMGNSLGGTLFFGLTDVGASITSITYFAGSPSSDAVGIDDVRYGAAIAPVPEPTTLALMGLGLAGIGYRRHRSKISA